MQTDAAFWDRIAAKYRATPIRNAEDYDAGLARVVSHLRPTDHVLEIGCGTGGTALRLAPHVARMVASDFAPGMIAQAKDRAGAEAAEFVVGDVHASGFEPGSFDAVLGFNLFHLVPDFDAQLARCHGLLKPGGLLICKTPCLTDPSARLRYKMMTWAVPVMQALGKAPFVKFRTIAQLQTAVEAAGFEIIETGNYPAQPPSHLIVARKV
ncbi:class I SAM-dependent methyltransferase [Aliishimia ponticola]|uniref:Class I SAM-dependent methyltransferase n=1 Tax=Aliishimia ponticola TaxID=2499833 RepID=A0A4S4NBM4_9RHOB|nr:class I SAM-dependent methyltransferase [Aliishimia ponticola]THH36816.1 class I SAM-dependent methyltransferase [Aliishimia ponticola]